jgi:hypothetical protein
MLNPSVVWAAFEAEDERAAYAAMSYAEALARFERLWDHARTLRPDIGDDWRDDLEGDLAIARALNGFPAA